MSEVLSAIAGIVVGFLMGAWGMWRVNCTEIKYWKEIATKVTQRAEG